MIEKGLSEHACLSCGKLVAGSLMTPEGTCGKCLAKKRAWKRASQATAERARRSLLRRRLSEFAKAVVPDYECGWVHEEICARLEKFSEAVVERKSPRLMLFMPPRHGKSTLAAQALPAWHLGRNPSHEVICCSYADSLAEEHSRRAVAMMRSDAHRRAFPHAGLDPKRQSVGRWLTAAGGGYRAAGVGTGITGQGANCLEGGTPVGTPRGSVPIEDVEVGDEVLTRDPKTGGVGISRVLATASRLAEELLEIRAMSGRTVRATREHRFAVPGEAAWREAGDLKERQGLAGWNGADAVEEVRPVRGAASRVWDIQVEGTECFFAGGLLVHNCLIVDDPVKDRKSADSRTVRDDTMEWFDSTAYTRLSPGGGVLLIQTRWHRDDLAGRLLARSERGEGDEYQVASFPALATRDGPRRRKGDALHPARYPAEALEAIRSALPEREWSALYDQNPIPEGGSFFRSADVGWYDRESVDSTRLSHYQAWDFALGSDESSDWTVGIDVGMDDKGVLYGMDIVRGRMEADEIVEAMIDLWRKWRPEMVGGEHGHIMQTLGPWLRRRCEERGASGMAVEKLRHGGRDKRERARSIQAAARAGRLRFPKGDPKWVECLSEMEEFDAGTHDDMVDALSWIGLMLDVATPPRPVRAKEPPRRRTDLWGPIGRPGDDGRSTMAA